MVASQQGGFPRVADMVLVQGMIYPASWESGTLLSMAIAGGKIVHLGPEAGLSPWKGPNTRVIDLKGKMVLPGFVDAHLHPLLGGLSLLDCNLSGLATLSAYHHALQAYAAAHPNAPFIRGGGWTGGAFPNERPTKESLDAVSSDRPVFLKAMDGHSMWANSLALRMAHIDAQTPQPPGGWIEKDSKTGEPTGWLKEWSALALIESCFPAATHEQWMSGARAFMQKANQAGITSVSEAMMTESDYRVYADLDQRGELSVRIHGMALCRPEDGDADRQKILHLLRQPGSDYFQARSVKLFLDGVVEAHTAWLEEPYADQPQHRGTLIWPEEAFMREVSWWDAQTIPVHIHAIGDAASKLAVDALEVAIRKSGHRQIRHQIAHLDMVHRSEIERMAQLHILGVVQPAWAYVDHAFFDSALPFLGRERASRLYPLLTLSRSGVTLACGSDWPYGGDDTSLSPLEAIQVGATRLGLAGDYPTPYSPEECLPLRTLLDAYTRNGAYAQFRENEFGTLGEGMKADLIVLDGNLLEMGLNHIHSARILLTLVEGRPVFHAADWLGL